MSIRMKIEIGIAALCVASLFVVKIQREHIADLRAERDKFKNNTTALLMQAETYRVRDSLSAARVQTLRLTLDEYEQYREEDAKLIRSLQVRNRDLTNVNSTQAQTIIALRSVPRDTVIIRDSVRVPAVAVHCGDAWYDFDGVLTEREFTGALRNRDSLIVAETVQYKRFLGFLWKTNKVKDRRVDVVSKNPHTRILNIEHILINN